MFVPFAYQVFEVSHLYKPEGSFLRTRSHGNWTSDRKFAFWSILPTFDYGSFLFTPCGMKFLRVLIFAVFPAIRKNRFRQKKIANVRFSNLNSLHNNTALRNRFCLITACLFHSETTKYWFIASKYVSLLHVLNKNENIYINTGYWVLCENRKN